MSKRKAPDNFIRRALYFIPALLIAIMIFSFSCQDAEDSTKVSQSLTTDILMSISRLTGNEVTVEEVTAFIDKYETPVRKAAHFTEYAAFGFFILFGLYHNGLTSKRMLLLSILIVFLYALSDEFHQLFSPGRSAQIKDVLIDTAGGTAGTLLYAFLHRKK